VIRTSSFFGPWDRYSFVHAVLRDLSAGLQVEASDAVLVSPTYVPDLVHASLDLLIDRATGIWHLSNQGSVSWHELASRAALEAGLDVVALVKSADDQPRVTVLSSERGLIMPTLDSAIQRFVRESTIAWEPDNTSEIAVG
jgi:dTDP-4-dehydrorhamnose reductase